MTAGPNAAIVTAVEQLREERDELLDLLRTVISGVPSHAEYAAVHLSPELLGEIRRRTN